MCGVDVDPFIAIVSLQYESSGKIYTLDVVDVNSLNEFILNHKSISSHV